MLVVHVSTLNKTDLLFIYTDRLDSSSHSSSHAAIAKGFTDNTSAILPTSAGSSLWSSTATLRPNTPSFNQHLFSSESVYESDDILQ
jgi:hypothetical protein